MLCLPEGHCVEPPEPSRPQPCGSGGHEGGLTVEDTDCWSSCRGKAGGGSPEPSSANLLASISRCACSLAWVQRHPCSCCWASCSPCRLPNKRTLGMGCSRFSSCPPSPSPALPPTAPHRSPGLSAISSSRSSACSSHTRCSLLLAASLLASSSSSMDVSLQGHGCWVGVEPRACQTPCLRPGPTHECCTLSIVSSFSCSSPCSRPSVSSSKLSSKVTAGGTSESYLQNPVQH